MLDFGFYHMDCMEGMKEFPDKFFDIAVVDPPYFPGPNKRRYYGRSESTTKIARKMYDVIDDWNVPGKEYFDELIRVSKHQIIWGCNYYEYHFGSGRIVWDKCRSGTSFSKAEIAYCSLHNTVEIFRYMWDGMMQGKSIDEGYEVPGTSASYFETSGSDPLISILHRSHGLQSGSLPSLLHNLFQAPGYWRLQYHFPDRSL